MDVPSQKIQQVRGVGHERVPKAKLEFGQAKSVGRFTDRYQFFTPALLYLYGGLDDRPFVEFMEETGTDLVLASYRFERPIFSGLAAPDGDPSWNHVLFAVEKEHWKKLENYLLSAMLVDRSRNWLCQVGATDLVIADPLVVDRGELYQLDWPLLNIVALGVDSNKAAISVCPPRNPWRDRPFVNTFPPFEKTKELARSILVQDELNQVPDILDKESPDAD